ncbi:MAG: hypothetical protein INR63_24465 [Actinomycetospora chiangmaiensis]|nr:hypothetical protein [Actinomycetospora chiangmaiensis]
MSDDDQARAGGVGERRVAATVTCRWDAEARARVLVYDPPEAEGRVWSPIMPRLQPGDMISFELVASGA